MRVSLDMSENQATNILIKNITSTPYVPQNHYLLNDAIILLVVSLVEN